VCVRVCVRARVCVTFSKHLSLIFYFFYLFIFRCLIFWFFDFFIFKFFYFSIFYF
jgi:hypothetical protein